MSPLARAIGFARTGPSMPAGSHAGSDHSRPDVVEVMCAPLHDRGLGPTLK